MEIIISSLIFVVFGTFAIGYGFGSSSLSDLTSTMATSLLDRFETTYLSSASSSNSSWWNLYTTIVSSYITIRIFNLFLNPILELIASKIYNNKSNQPPNQTVSSTPSSSSSSSSAASRSLPTTRSMTKKDRSDLIPTDENESQDDNEKQKDQHQHQKHNHQPINMTGNYQLVLNENFEAFLGTQGVPRMFQSIACKSRPIHRIVHIKNNISIKVEGIVETYTEFTINGPSIVTKIRGKPFNDSVTYLTLEELGLKPKQKQKSKSNQEPTTTTTTTSNTTDNGNDADATANANATANPSSSGDDSDDYASGGDSEYDGDNDNDDNDNDNDNDNDDDKRNNNKRVSSDISSRALNKIKKRLSSRRREIKDLVETNVSKGGNLRASKVKRLINQNNKTSSSDSIEEQQGEDNEDDDNNETNSIVGAIDDNKKKRNSSHSSSNGNGNGNGDITTAVTDTVCGIKNTKRQDDEKYTLTVNRRFQSLKEKSKIEMILRVVYDDPKKDDVIAKQLYERII